MKKLFTLIAVALLGTIGLEAQTITITKADGSSITLAGTGVKSIAYSPAEAYMGTDTVCINNMPAWTYAAENIVYGITKNSDGTIDVTKPEEVFANTVIGTITQGTYTVKGLTYDEATKSYVRDYAGDNTVVSHIKTVSNGKVNMDKDYTFSKGKLVVKLAEDGSVTVTDTYSFGSMPFPIYSTFKGSKH